MLGCIGWRTYSFETSLNWSGAPTKFLRTLLASWSTATKSPMLNPKLMVAVGLAQSQSRVAYAEQLKRDMGC